MTPSKRFPRTALGWVAVAAIIGALGVVSKVVWSSVNGTPNRDPGMTAAAARGAIERTVVAAGVVQPLEFVDVGAQISGQLKSLKVKLGERVKRGQLLAEIDATLNQAKLIEAEATVENLRAQRHAKQEQLVLAQLQKKRGETLLRQDALARAEVEIIDSNYRVAVTGVSSLDAQIKQAQAILTTAQTNLGYTRIVAPMDGEIVTIVAREGQTLNANQQAPMLMRIARLDTMTVWAQVPEAEVTRLKVGHPVHFSVLGEPDQRREGRIRQILPGPEVVNGVVFYNALFDVPNPDGVLKVQMTAQVFFIVEQAADALLIPLSALGADSRGRPNHHRVNVVKADGTTDRRTVETGIKDGAIVQVLKGLEEGERVAVDDDEPRKPAKKSGSLPKAKPR
jgi:membrane fusion protein, macrolide-specific efflux system